MQTVRVELPQVGESIIEAIIGKWLKKTGDTVKRYDPLVEVITDKVNLEVPSPYDGVLTRILAEEGSVVPIGGIIAEIKTSSDIHSLPIDLGDLSVKNDQLTGYLDETNLGVGPTGGANKPNFADPDNSSEVYSPVVTRLANEHKIDLSLMQGSGSNNRVTKKDILEFIASHNTISTSMSYDNTSTADVHANSQPLKHKLLKLTPVRKLIARNMVKSASTIPHAWAMIDVDVTDLVAYRRSLNQVLQRSDGLSITLLPFLISAISNALMDHPKLNASWSENGIHLFDDVNIGVAVAAPDGLVVPVIHNADKLSIKEINLALRDLSSKAQKGLLNLSDVQNGTFTVNNTGALGFVLSQPIINPPQVAILTTEKVQKRPVIINDEIAIRSMMNVSMSFDHRPLDGLEASAFLRSLKTAIETMQIHNHPF